MKLRFRQCQLESSICNKCFVRKSRRFSKGANADIDIYVIHF